MKQKIYKKILTLAAVLLSVNLVFAFSLPALATDSNAAWGGDSQKDYVAENSGLPTDLNDADPRRLITDIIRILLGFLGILAVIIIIYAGFRWMTAGGNEENVSAAKKTLLAGLIGLVIILSAYAVASFVIESIYNAGQ